MVWPLAMGVWAWHGKGVFCVIGIGNRSLWLCGLLLCVGLLRVLGAPPTFGEWKAACDKLPPNRVLNGRMPPRGLLPLPDFGEVDRVLDEYFAQSTNGPLSNAALWLGSPPRRETFLDVTRSWFATSGFPFEPFVRKLVLPADAKVFVEGDLHGDIRTLLAVLGRLQERRLLDGFQIVDPNFHIVFLGDYTDRGLYGVEVLYTLLRLKLANPDRVHLGRGNHEDANLAARYGFLAEGQGQYGAGFKAEKVLRAYDFLPVVLYLGCGTNFVQVCHGGMEPGFAPGGLLVSEGTNRFQLLGALKQAAFLAANPQWLGSSPEAGVARGQFTDFVPSSPTSPNVIGFMWNDFTVFRDEPAFAHNPERAFVYGQPAVDYLLRTAGQGEARLRAVIRAHQHSGISNPMMRRLVAGQGLFRHWQETNSPAARDAEPSALVGRIEGGASRALPEGSVWTFNVGPDSVYGLGCGFSFATYGVLTLGTRFEDWRVAVETVEVPLTGWGSGARRP
jgi:hypothetical protein